MQQLRDTLLAEFIATFTLVFFGCGAIVVDELSGGAIGHLGISFTFGFVVMIMIYSFGPLSGAHMNPAVTIAFWLAKLFAGNRVLPYVLVQVLAAIAACALLLALFPEVSGLGHTYPKVGVWQVSFAFELLLTFILMLVILQVATGSTLQQHHAAFAIGLTVLIEAMVGGPICGASMNPARSIGPALVSGQLADIWIYISAPPLGAALAIVVWKLTKHRQQ